LIVVFGTVCVDRIRGIKAFPQLGGYVPITSETYVLGGEAVNTASHLKRWGATYRLIGNPPATDEEGRRLTQLLEEADLKLISGNIKAVTTPICDIYITPDGERTMFGRGFDEMIAPPASSFKPSPGGWLTSDANVRPIADDYARAAKAGGMSVYLMDFRAPKELLGPGDVWQGSTDWIGEHGDSNGNIDHLRMIVETTGCFGILTDGANGFVAGSAETGIHHTPACRVKSVKDSTGAGDGFRAGMLFGLDQGWPMPECLQFAASAGALSTQFEGGTTGPSLEDVRAAK
jgi:sugar/nucleoside kinase (ribokinase family)